MRISDWSSDVCSSDLKGIKPGRIVRRHILRNILIPVVTVIGMEFGSLIAYSTITETVFSWPGMGKLLIDSVYQLDRPVIVAYVMLVTRSEERRVGKECVSTCSSWWWAYH